MSRSNPYVFTEQGIYTLMTVLKADLAVQQSMALIRLFKQMKDYNAAGNAPDVSAGMVALATQTSLNTRDIAEIATDVRTLSNKVERNESFLQKVMTNFIDPSTFKHFLILNGQRLVDDSTLVILFEFRKRCRSDPRLSIFDAKNSEFIMEETFKTKGTCATTIQFTRDGDFIRNIRFTGGCNGNLKAIAKLCEGMKAEDIAAKLLGNTCGGKPTSCADQLARAVLGKEA